MGHRLIDDVLPEAPSWFHEGVASFIETAFLRDSCVWYGMPSPLVLFTLRDAPILPLQTLVDTRVGDQRNHEARYYATSWLLIHYIFLNADGQHAGKFKTLWRLIGAQEDDAITWADVLSETFEGMSLAQLEVELQRHGDSVVKAGGRIQKMRQIPVDPLDEVTLSERPADPEFVREACIDLRRRMRAATKS